MIEFGKDIVLSVGCDQNELAVKQNGACPYCDGYFSYSRDRRNGGSCLKSIHNHRWVCTRKKGHDGPCVACCASNFHILSGFWHQNEEYRACVLEYSPIIKKIVPKFTDGV